MNKSAIIKWAGIAVIVGSVMWAIESLPLQKLTESLNQWIKGLGIWGPVVFGLIYIIATICFVPGLILTIAAGAAFGLLKGFISVSISSVVGASCAFLIARYLARGKVEDYASRNPKFNAIDRAVGEGGWKIVGLLRLSPAIPFNLQNYLYGLTSVQFWPFVLVSWIAMAPGTLTYVYVGHVAGVAASGDEASTARWVLLCVGLLATVAVTVYITYLAKQKLKETEVKQNEPEAAENEASQKQANRRPFVYVGLAVVTVLIAATMQYKSDTVTSWLSSLTGGPPEVEMQETYSENQGGPTFDHSVLTEILSKHVDDAGWVDYEALQQNSDKLDTYLTTVGDAPFDQLGRDEKLTLLINAYNAFTLKLILENLPLDSIKDIPADKRWEAQRWKVGDNTWSLNQIEHEQIRPNFEEPRIHFALVCAAVGCPPLATEAFTADNLDDQLARQTEYVHDHETWLQVNDGTLRLTKLYKWYAGDFEQSAGSVLDYVAEKAEQVDAASSLTIEYLDYDWALNSVANRQPR